MSRGWTRYDLKQEQALCPAMLDVENDPSRRRSGIPMAPTPRLEQQPIVYAWVNDENTLRKAGSKTDPYSIFRTMLDAGDPPGTMAGLLAVSAKIEIGRSSQHQAASKPRKKPNRIGVELKGREAGARKRSLPKQSPSSDSLV
jgi:hypothetical protein